MKKLLNLVKTIVLVLVCCMIVSVPVSASNQSSTAKWNVTLKGKTVLLTNNGNTAFTLKSLKKNWGKPNVKKGEMGLKEYTFKSGKSYVYLEQYYFYTDDGIAKGYIVTIRAVDKNLKINGVRVGMTKTVALKALRKSFGKSNVKICKSDEDSTKKCIRVVVGTNDVPIEFIYNSKGKITKISGYLYMLD